MFKFIAKTAGGVLLGLLLCSAGSAATPGIFEILLSLLWGIGIVQVFPSLLRMMGGLLSPALKLSVISWLSLGTGILGLILLLLVFSFSLIVGWIYGVYLAVVELRSLL